MNTDELELALYRAERRVREIQTKEPYQKLGPPPASLQVTHTVARVSDKAHSAARGLGRIAGGAGESAERQKP